MDNITFEDLNNMNLPNLERVDVLANARILHFKGAIDKATLPALLEIKDKMAAITDINDQNIILDFAKVTHVDLSTGIQLLSRVSELQKAHKRLGLINAPEELAQMVGSGDDGENPIQIFASEEEAIKNLNTES